MTASDTPTWSGRTGPDNEAGVPTSDRDFEWSYRGAAQELTLTIPGWLLDYYQRRPRSAPYGVFVADPYDRDLLDRLANYLHQYAERNDLDDRETIHFAARFVQSLGSVSDARWTDRASSPQYPVETLVYRGGDARDATLLGCALLDALGYDAAPIAVPSVDPDHFVVGVPGVEPAVSNPRYFESDGDRYYPLETTQHGRDLGELRSRYHDVPGSRYETDTPVLVTQWAARLDARGASRVDATVTNLGAAAASNATVTVAFENADGDVVASDTLSPAGTTVPPNRTIRFQERIDLPAGAVLQARARIFADGYRFDETTSNWARATVE